jgi:uncharacterized membrane protein
LRIKACFRKYRSQNDGAVAIIVALFLTVAVGFMAIGIDLGSLYFRQKALQTQADMTAVSAVLNLSGTPDDHAQATVIGNRLDALALTSLAYGRYIYDSAIPSEDRFETRDLSDVDVNAAEVVLKDAAPLFFSQTFLDTDSTPLSASATAARFDFASFSLGSRLLDLDGGILNALLGAALGSNVSLSLLDYQALLDTPIDLLTFADALAVRADLVALDYADILTSEIDLLDVAGAILDTGLVSGSTDVLTAILNCTACGSFNASELIGISGDNVAIQLEDRLGTVSVSALDVLKATLDIVNANRLIEADVSLPIPNVLGNVDLAVVVGEREAHSSWINLGERGATLHTAQVRLKLDVDLSPSLLSGLGVGVSALALRLPVYAEIASATVTLTDLYCDASGPNDRIASFDTGLTPFTGTNGTHVVEMFIGEFDAPTFADTTTPLDAANLNPADFLDLELNLALITIDLFTLQLKAHAATGNALQPQIDFLVSDIAGSPKTVGSGSLLTSTIASLLDPNNLEISVSSQSQSILGGLLSFLLAPVVALVDAVLDVLPGKLLGALLTPIDALLDGVLNVLGIGIGQADLTLDGVACGKVVLVR